MISFNEKIESIINHIKIEVPKTPKYLEHIYADFIELNALFLKEEITISDISDLLIDVKDSNLHNTEDSNNKEIGSEAAEESDKISDKIKALFELCAFRSRFYNSSDYPFEIATNQIRLKSEITDKQKIYLFLLLSSNLSYFEDFEYVLTKEFEMLCLYCMKAYLNKNAVIHSFGKNSHYRGNAETKIRELSLEIGVNLNEDNVTAISKNNVQERGCDIVAWLPFKDHYANFLIFLCQCACGKDWEHKQAETPLFKNYFYFNVDPIHSMFVPYSLTNSNGNFFLRDRISNNLFFERNRIIELLTETHFFEQLESNSIINILLRKRIPIN